QINCWSISFSFREGMRKSSHTVVVIRNACRPDEEHGTRGVVEDVAGGGPEAVWPGGKVERRACRAPRLPSRMKHVRIVHTPTVGPPDVLLSHADTRLESRSRNYCSAPATTATARWPASAIGKGLASATATVLSSSRVQYPAPGRRVEVAPCGRVACDRLRRTSTRQPLARARRLSRMTGEVGNNRKARAGRGGGNPGVAGRCWGVRSRSWLGCRPE